MSNILYIEKNNEMIIMKDNNMNFETEVDENGIMSMTISKKIDESELIRKLENSEINNIKEEHGKIILDITTEERF